MLGEASPLTLWGKTVYKSTVRLNLCGEKQKKKEKKLARGGAHNNSHTSTH